MADLCTREEVKRERRLTDTALDTLIDDLIPRASAALEAYAGRRFAPDDDPSVRYFPVAGREVLIDDLSAAPTAISFIDRDGAESSVTVELVDVAALPRNRVSTQPITALRFPTSLERTIIGGEVAVTGVWGHPEIPADIREAAIVTVIEWMKDGQGLTPQTAVPFEVGAPPSRGLPQRARDLVRQHRYPTVA